MPDDPGKDMPSRPTGPEANPRDVLRSVLWDLMELSPGSVAEAESRIERRRRSVQKTADEQYRRASRRIERRFQSLETEGKQAYRDLVERIESRFTSELGRLDGEKRTVRARIRQEAQENGHATKQKLEQEIWLAESVFEASKNQLRKDARQVKKDHAAKTASLEALQQRADWLLAEYRQDLPPAPDPGGGASMAEGDLAAAFHRSHEEAKRLLDELESLRVPQWFRGLRPYGTVIFVCAVPVALAAGLDLMNPTVVNLPDWPPLILTGPLGFVAGLLVSLGAGIILRRMARSQVMAVYPPFREAVAVAGLAAQRELEEAPGKLHARESKARERQKSEIDRARAKYEPQMARITGRHKTTLERVEEDYARSRADIEQRRDRDRGEANAWPQRRRPRLQQRYERYRSMARERHVRQTAVCQQQYEADRAELEGRWQRGLAKIEALVDDAPGLRKRFLPDWHDSSWRTWVVPTRYAPVVGFGELQADLKRIASTVHQYKRMKMDRSATIGVPALLAFPDACSLLLQADREGLDEAIRALQTVMLSLLITLPPGRVHFTILDPVGLGQNFAGFMHLADYEEAMVGGRIWTESAHIEQQLTQLTNHMENVIQKYLRNEFATIDEYNAEAGELAEPYRFLVVANFPVNFTEEAGRRLNSIASSGARCGVYTLIAHDLRQETPPGLEIEDLEARSVHLVHDGGRFVWKDAVFGDFPLTLAPPPTEDTLTEILHRVGAAAKDSTRVEVPFEIITPAAGRTWTGDGTEDVRVPIGRSGATRLQHLRLGRGVAQHALVVGKTGSGKSTLLHVIVTNLALWYSPDEVEFYLVDFKKGVEFKTYATHALPHARAIAIESDREFGLSVLRRLDAEIDRRGDLFRRTGVQDLPAYRRAKPSTAMPRTLLIIDEFQVLFSEDDKLAHDAAMLLDRLVRQGRAFGVHVLLGSQTLGGTSGLARSTIGQMAVRIALQCSEADSQLILNDDNTAARLLSRPGEAIYNDAGGLVEGNSPFQTAWLPEQHREKCLHQVGDLARDLPQRSEPMIIFEGNTPADIRVNRPLAELLEAPGWPTPSSAPRAWLGEAIAIKDPTAAVFRRQSGANLLLVGQRDDAALAMMTSAMVGLAAQHDPQSAKFIILDGTPADSAQAGAFARVAAILPHATRLVEWRDVPDAVAELAAEVKRRQEAGQIDAPAVYLLIYRLQRYRSLRGREDDFSFSTDDEPKAPDTGAQFSELLRDAPPLGVHVLAWVDTPTSLERMLDRQTLREFDNRVLFQMSASDSSNLIDTPDANRLGFYRALLHSEERGLQERFRPYAALDASWLDHARHCFDRKTTAP